jgi:AraC-like DNA-binding protein
MNNIQQINWDSQDVLLQLVDNIQSPLMVIINSSNKREENRKSTRLQKKTNEIILTSSKQIADIIEELVTKIENKRIEIIKKIKQPRFFNIVKNNKRIQTICCKHKSLDRISKTDQEWLLQFEEEVIGKMDDAQRNLFDLSYTLAVSERQLHRKIKELLGITPNKYIRIIKLAEAKKMLENYTYDMISEVSYAVGYNDAYYFSKLFTDIYDITPAEILKENE